MSNKTTIIFKSTRYGLLTGKLKYHWHINIENFEADLSKLAQSITENKNTCDNFQFADSLFEIIFDAAAEAGMNIFSKSTDLNRFFFDAMEGAHPFLSFKRLLIKHALRSHCILDSLCSIIDSPPCSLMKLPYHTNCLPLYFTGAFALSKIYSSALKTENTNDTNTPIDEKNKTSNIRKSKNNNKPLYKKCYDLLNIKMEDQTDPSPVRTVLHRIRQSDNDKFFIRKNGIHQLAGHSDKSTAPCLSIADAYWTVFMLLNKHNSISQYENSLNGFTSRQYNYPARIIEILQDLISVERSFQDTLPDTLITPQNPDKIFSGHLEEYKSCDFLLNYIKFENTFRLQYYIDILVLLHNKNPEIFSDVQISNSEKKERKYTDSHTQCIRQLEELPATYLIKLCSYLDTMPNVFSRTLFLSYAFDCYYTLEHCEHNLTAEPPIRASTYNYNENVNPSGFNTLASWSELILYFLIYVNKELLPVLTELWQAASDYLDLCLSGDSEEYETFSNIIVSYAASCKDDLTLDFASLSTQTLNELAAEFKHETYGISPDSQNAWNCFQNTIIPKIRKKLAMPSSASDELSGLAQFKNTLNTYNHRKNIFSKDDLRKIEQLIIKTCKKNTCEKLLPDSTDDPFSIMLNLKNSICKKENFYDSQDTYGITPANFYLSQSRYWLSKYYFETGSHEFESE